MSNNGVFIAVGIGKIGDDVRMSLRSLAVNAPGSNVILLADTVMWKYLQREVESNNVQGINLLVMSYEKIAATSSSKFNELALDRFYCLYKTIRMLMYARGPFLTQHPLAWHNITSGPGIPLDIGAILIADLRDVVFQRDPFKQLWFERDKSKETYPQRGIMVVSEEWPRPVSHCSVNREWVDVCLGKAIAPLLGNIHCAGSFMASPIIMYSFIKHLLIPSMQSCISKEHGIDQGIFNVLTHYYEYSNDPKAKAVFSAHESANRVYHLMEAFYNRFNPILVTSTIRSGWITTMGASFFDDEPMRLMIYNSTKNNKMFVRPCALCHQYDRDRPWKRRFKRLYNQLLNTSLPTCSWMKDIYGLGDSCVFEGQYRKFYANVKDTMQNPAHKVPMCVGVIAYQGYKTLSNTLNTYTNNHLLDVVEESILLFQKIDDKTREAYAYFFLKNFTKFNRLPIIEKTNTVFDAIGKIARACTAKYILILEEDFALYVFDKEDIVEQLLAPIHLIEEENIQAVRMRRRKAMGVPDYARMAFEKGGIGGAHLFNHVAWQDYAESEFPAEFRVCMNAPKAWCTDSFYADYTNNPTIYETKFLTNLLAHATQIEKDAQLAKFESSLTDIWRPSHYGVAWVDGLFTHDRIDRTMALP